MSFMDRWCIPVISASLNDRKRMKRHFDYAQ
jgi:hypothetical protein